MSSLVWLCVVAVGSAAAEPAVAEPAAEAVLRPRHAELKYVHFSEHGVATSGGRTVHLAERIVRESEAADMIAALRELVPDEGRLDSTDGLPAYEMYLREKGADVPHAAAPSVPPLAARLEAFAEQKLGCTECALCTVLLRRYQANERMAVPSHFDRNAYATAVVSLNPAEFDGGLFLQRAARSDSREFFSVGGRDAIFHSYDLNHGVDVRQGTRYSAVFWLAPGGKDVCASGASPWYRSDAEAGNAEAQEALGELHQLGRHGYPRDAQAAAHWSTLAAEQGQPMAQSRLGRMLLAGEGVDRDVQTGMRWVRAAAEQGYPPAEYTMGVACQYGDAEGGLEEAARWFARAAEVGVAKAQYELGVAFVNGDGVEMNRTAGVHWLLEAAAQGHAEAKEDLGTLEAAGIFSYSQEAEAEAGGTGGEASAAKSEL